jgi:alpha-D-glucose phosphate-specific phosphoglucomutase
VSASSRASASEPGVQGGFLTNTAISFGTDGWRAIIAEDYTAPNVRLCAQGVASYLRAEGTADAGIVIGYDTRFGSYRFAIAAAEVLAANDVPVYLCNTYAPTPAVSFNLIAKKAAGAIVITASHNPPEWNGFKYKPDYGGSASPEIVEALETQIGIAADASEAPARLEFEEATRSNRIELFDPKPPYLAHLRTLVDLDRLKSSPLRIAVDPMYGAGIGYLTELLSDGSIQLDQIHGEINPAFPGFSRPEPISHNLGPLRDQVLRRQLAIGLATDGDADRVGGVDENGRAFTPLEFFALLAHYLLEIRGERGALVKSLTCSRMIDRLGDVYGVPVHTTPVGFKYLGPKMIETDALIGGEESGGFGFRGHIPERDGVLSSLYLLDAMVRSGKTASGLLEELFETVGHYEYDRLDLLFASDERSTILERVRSAQPKSLAGIGVAEMSTADGFRYDLVDGSWALVRFSGTEPLLRIYAEAPSMSGVQQLIAAGRKLAGI